MEVPSFWAITRIPPEILSDIFRLCLTKHDDWNGARNKCLAALSSVCTVWRNTALTTSDLWSFIHLDDVYMPPKECIETWILRAGTHPLTFVIEWEDDQVDSLVKIQQDEHFEVFLRHIKMTREVDLIVSTEYIERLSRQMDPWPKLHKFSLRPAVGCDPTPLSPLALPAVEVQILSPTLNEVTILEFSVVNCLFPWQQIRVCDFGGQLIEDCLGILQQCNNFVVLKTNSFKSSMDTHNLETVICSNLKELCMLHDPRDPTHLLDSISTPSLQLLRLCCPDTKSLTSLARFLDRSNCDLTELRIYGLHCMQDEFNDVLNRVPHLGKLKSGKH